MDEQANLLTAWGCDRLQGYYDGKPLDGAATAALLRAADPAAAVNSPAIAV
jgi:EAL domain-containing protein (putative c-di-GMP-specific phosphodiesterase class I)